MKEYTFIHPDIDYIFKVNSEVVSTIIIENQRLLRKICLDIRDSLEGNDGQSVVSYENTPIEFTKNVEFITDYTVLSSGNKSIQTKLCSYLEHKSIEPNYLMKSQKILSDIENLVYEMSVDLPSTTDFTKLTMNAILKATGVILQDDSYSNIEAIYDYMEIIRELDRDKLFIFLNFRDFFDDNEVELFERTAIQHDFKILMIESIERKKLLYENRLIIDEDYCII